MWFLNEILGILRIEPAILCVADKDPITELRSQSNSMSPWFQHYTEASEVQHASGKETVNRREPWKYCDIFGGSKNLGSSGPTWRVLHEWTWGCGMSPFILPFSPNSNLLINLSFSFVCVFFFLGGGVFLGSCFSNSRSITLKDLVTFIFSCVFITTFSAFL